MPVGADMMRITAAQFKAVPVKKEGRVKNARKTEVDGIKFDSALEARRWSLLSTRAKLGHITGLRRQVPIPLQGRDGPVLTPTGRPMRYVADFTYLDGEGREVIEDAKGHKTEVYLIKKAILAAQGITVREITAAGDDVRQGLTDRQLRDQAVAR